MERLSFEVEICAGNIQSVQAAYQAGANRVELCDNLNEGGTTPSVGTILLAKEKYDIDVFPIIRPRGGNFVYDAIEEEIMIQDIKQAVVHGADGVVIGALNNEGEIDYNLCCRLIEAARGLPVTFHRAFDQCKDPFKSLEILISMGITRLLTSGQKNTAIEGAQLIAELQQLASQRLKLMPGGGINEENIVELAQKTKVKCFHASLRDIYPQQKYFRRENVKFNSSASIPEDTIKASSESKIKTMIHALESI